MATDASNKGTTKCFPVVLRYLHFEEGVQHALLDFYSDSNEKSEAITHQLLAKLEKSGLDVQNMSAYAASELSEAETDTKGCVTCKLFSPYSPQCNTICSRQTGF